MSYKIYYATSATTDTWYYVGSSTTTSYIDDYLLEPEKTYYYKVSAVNGGGEGPLSSSASATTLAVQTSGTAELHIYNDSDNDPSGGWNIVWRGVWDVDANAWWISGNVNITGNNDESKNYLEPGKSLYWDTVPSGKRYWVRVKDDYEDGDEFDSESFYLSPNQVKKLSYDGYSLKVIYD